ncbi:MAG: 3-deoxy-7-phosphoheptulonate synthase [Armatimonadetes bacterium]|nr:3-deoxy-7-phosphoheptulonate synthase [Armatimonadota bacterium]
MENLPLASKNNHPDNTVISLNGLSIGAKEIVMIAGPCAVEDLETLRVIGKSLKSLGIKILRGGAFKPRTSPYSFQGLGQLGLKYLAEVKKEFNLLITTEVMQLEDIKEVSKVADILQVGSRHMQNYPLLKALGKIKKPILLKRGMMASISELLMSAEYILKEGNSQVILCERGIRSFSEFTRFTLDLSAVPILKKITHLPVIIDPSHASGCWDLIEPLSKGALACGADGLLIEIHPNPEKSLSDGEQSLKLEKFKRIFKELKRISKALKRNII